MTKYPKQDLQKVFKQAIQMIKNPQKLSTTKKITNKDKLQFYGLFKQATEGPCKGKAPSRTKFVQRAKYMAWKEVGSDVSKEKAMRTYIQLLDSFVPGWYASPKL